ncbi:MAG: M24 family metallopeptidase [Thermoleophilia bacterium]|nr:M24 family metallopeptidase [Thermoleophilia bacterium]
MTHGVTGPRETWPDERAMARAEEGGGSFELLRAERERRGELPEPAGFDRLPLEWYQRNARRLKEAARERGVDGGLFLTSRWNVIYATGLFHTTTERPFACFLPMDDDEACVWLHPQLDAELVRGWWCTEAFSYFDFPHAEGGAPSEGGLGGARTVDVFGWWGETLARLGYGGRTIGIDSGGLAELGLMPGFAKRPRYDFFAGDVPEPHRPEHGPFGRMADALPDARFVDVHDLLVRHRAVKDEAETRLARRALDYLSEIHAFARDYLLERGPGTIDWEVANAARLWGMHRLLADLPQAAEPHGAPLTFVLACRSGVSTAYPHPNQTLWSRVERGDAIQVAGLLQLGGCGGELYRSYLVAPWSEWQEHVWEVHTRAFEIQAEESYAGNSGAAVARAVHAHQVENGCAHLVYHRPGHGMGSEGHQPPYHALGDFTVLRAGMHFSNEPGLYDAEHGFGFNHGDTILVAEERGIQLGTVPATKEWCLLSP